jgi:hypothetical protein
MSTSQDAQRPPGRIVKVRNSLQDNKVFLATVGWLILSSVALLFSYWGNRLLTEQNAVLQSQKQLAEQQTELTRLQTDIARATVSPKFVFESGGKDSEPPHLLVKNVGELTRDQEGEAIHFFEFNNQAGQLKRFRVKGVYPEKEVAWRSGNMYFYHGDVIGLMLYHEGYIDHVIQLSQQSRGLSELLYVKLTYVNRAGEQRIEQYIKPVQSPPKMDAEFDATPFRKPNDKESKDEAKKRGRVAATAFLEFLRTL